MSPTKTFPAPAYTPEQMKQFLTDALSPSPSTFRSSLVQRHGESSKTVESMHQLASRTSSPPTSLSLNRSEQTPFLGRLPRTPDLTPYSSPIRPLNTSPGRDGEFTPARTFEVEHSFLQAMIGLLERQANIVPDYMITEADVRKIVRKEMAKRGVTAEDKDGNGEDSPKPLSHFLTASGMLGVMAVLSGFCVLRRTWILHPEEMARTFSAALKGAAYGIMGAIAVKGALRVVDKMRDTRE